ncbi:hypothetical protein KAR91_11525 [Candidatus Pacearchaeota archaeon]|nr:hypothetical protein [Candidatus Pacearchaeota archaeon]
MDKQEYLSSLKSTELRPPKVKKITVENKEEILLEDEYQSRGMSDIHAQIIKWFLKNPYPEDDTVHAFAEKLGMDPDEFEKDIYSVLSSFLSEGFSKGKDVDHDSDELKMGIEVEYEHTTNPLISRKIAMDHLVETPDYYTRLKKMEDEAEDYWSSKNDSRTQR